MMRRNISQCGFTILEIIITLMVTAVLSAIILQAMGTNTQRSAYPLFAVRNALSLQQVMENITADYKRFVLTEIAPIIEIQSRIDNEAYCPSDSFSVQISDPIEFSKVDGGSTSACNGYDLCYSEQPCSENCHVYRITITQTSTGRSLSALFTD